MNLWNTNVAGTSKYLFVNLGICNIGSKYFNIYSENIFLKVHLLKDPEYIGKKSKNIIYDLKEMPSLTTVIRIAKVTKLNFWKKIKKIMFHFFILPYKSLNKEK